MDYLAICLLGVAVLAAWYKGKSVGFDEGFKEGLREGEVRYK